METADRIRLKLDGVEQKLAWEYLELRAYEYLSSGFKGRIVLDFQQGRINVVLDQAAIAGVTQYLHYIDKARNNLQDLT